MSRPRQYRAAERCPNCNSAWITRRVKTGDYRCCGCSHTFAVPMVTKPASKSGSGVIAGKITIGAGSRWGVEWR
jgi:ribosomal protein L37AE/L43A